MASDWIAQWTEECAPTVLVTKLTRYCAVTNEIAQADDSPCNCLVHRALRTEKAEAQTAAAVASAADASAQARTAVDHVADLSASLQTALASLAESQAAQLAAEESEHDATGQLLALKKELATLKQAAAVFENRADNAERDLRITSDEVAAMKAAMKPFL